MDTTEVTGSLDGVAIVGMSGRFPGAKDIDAFWANLANGIETISHFTDQELEFSVADPESIKAGVKFVKARGVLAGADLFDATFFGIYPKDAELMDPQHRVFLECAWEALEHAGHDPEAYPGLIGVFAGLSLNTYLLYHLVRNRQSAAAIAGEYQSGLFSTILGNDKDFLPTRVAYKLNLRGPSMAIQSACSSSLVAVCQAVHNLQSFQCDMALAGGVSISFPQKRDYRFTEEGMISPDGHCRPFDAGAQGTVFGNGVAIVVLKRLADAIADKDTIHAVIKGAAVNNDGSQKVGFTAPGVEGQAEVITLAQAIAEVSPDTITCIEAHGTGTPLGDPIEMAGLTQAFKSRSRKGNYCAITTAKGHVGHLESAAGATGLIKTVLSLRHKLIPPVLNFTAPNPRIDLANSPFYINTSLAEWKTEPGVPRRAGVSSFGMGGTNAHLVVEEAPEVAPSGPSRAPQLLLLSAKSAAALRTMALNLADWLAGPSTWPLADVAFTLQCGRRSFPYRCAVVAADAAEAGAKLKATDDRLLMTGQAPARAPKVVFLFPGQGAQYVDMGRELYRSEPVFRSAVDHCAAILQRRLGVDLRGVLYPEEGGRDEAARRINETAITQPAIFVVEYALARLWLSWGIKPAGLIGHSIGEYVCAVLAETFTLEDALALLATRAKLMQALPAGSMMAVRLPAAELEPLLPAGAAIAALNSRRLCTISGPTDVLAALQKELEAWKVATRFLQTSHAFHSAMMDPMLPEFTAAAERTPRQPPKLPWVSSCTGQWMTGDEVADAKYWARQLRHTVRFADALDLLVSDSPQIFLEIGPGQTLSQMVRQHPRKAPGHSVVSSFGLHPDAGEEPGAMLAALGRLWTAGLAPDWKSFYQDEQRRRVPLPTYAFERKRHWIEPPAVEAQSGLPAISNGPAAGQVLPGEVPAAQSPEAAPRTAPHLAGSTLAVLPVARRDRLITRVKSAFYDLSGMEIPGEAVSFMELGYDSLFLTQASQALQKQFGIRITFRQLVNDLGNVSLLAEYLDRMLPAEPEAQAAAPALAAASTAPRAASAGVAAPPAVAATLVVQGFGPVEATARTPEPILTATQKTYLDALVARYVGKTAGSKALTQKYRQWYADPRTASGFNRVWKEMVYQIVVTRSQGARLWDIDGNEYIDMLNGFGPNFLGHSPDFIVRALQEQLARGIEVGPQSPLAGEAAKMFCELTGNERASFVCTGSEAVYAAMRLARTATGRDKIVVFTRDYHGNFDEVLVRAVGAPPQLRSLPIAPGIPFRAVEDMYVLDYGTDAALEFIRANAGQIAAVLVEPVQSRRPEWRPVEFIKALRQITTAQGSLLIFDEVITGLRSGPGGAQAYFGIKADLATYGKVAGAEMPVGIVAGKAEFMDTFDGGAWQYGDDSFPAKGVTFFAGTFVRHPLVIAAVHAMLKFLTAQGPEFWAAINRRAARLAETVDRFMVERDIPVRLPHFCSQMFVRIAEDQKYGNLLFYRLREKGIFVLEPFPSYLTAAHTDEDVDRMIAAFQETALELVEAGFLAGKLIPQARLVADAGTAPADRAETQAAVARPVDRFPLTDGQLEMWLAAQMSPEASATHNASGVVRLRGQLDLPALQRAVSDVIARHESLRARFAADGAEIIVSPAQPFALPVRDLSALPPLEQDRLVAAILEQEGRKIFDLLHGPLFSFQLVQLSASENLLLFSVQMIVCDGWGYNLVMEDLGAIYSAHAEGRPPVLPPAGPMHEYIAWQSRPERSAEIADCESFWLAQFTTIPPGLELPLFKTRPPARTFAGDRQSVRFGPELFSALKQGAREMKATPFSVLLAAFYGWLNRLSGQTDLVVGVPFAGQSGAGLEGVVGQCVHTLPLRIVVDPAQPFTNLLQRTREAFLDAQEHWNYGFGKLVQKLDVPKDASRIPLVSVILNLDVSMNRIKFAGCGVEITAVPRYYFQYDLGFNLVDEGTSLLVECDYNTNLFDAATVSIWLGHFETLLRSIISRPAQKVALLPVHPEPAGRFCRLDATASTQGDTATLHALVAAQCARSPGKVAVESGVEKLTYAELDQGSNRLANLLRSLGVGPEFVVGVCLERGLDMVVALLAVLKAGGAYLPIDPDLPATRITALIEDAGAKLVLAHSVLLPRIQTVTARVVCLDEDQYVVAGESTALEPAAVRPDNLAYVIFTSGSTGQPKGVEITHGSVVNFLNSMRKEPGLGEDDVMLALTTLSFDISVLEIFLPLVVGARIIVVTRDVLIDPHQLEEIVNRNGVTVMQGTPSTWRMLLNAGWKGSPSLKMLCGGEALPADLAAALIGAGREVWNLYGPTETTVWSMVSRVTNPAEVTLGRPIAHTWVCVVDDNLQPVPVGVSGELLIGGAGLARGYRNSPELTAARFIPDPHPASTTNRRGNRCYRTGDLVRFRPTGELEFVGRRDNQIKLRGHRIELGEVEATLLRHEKVRGAVVLLREDDGRPPALVAYLVMAGSTPEPGALRSELRAWLRGRLPEYMLPAALVFLQQLPRTPEGKQNRLALPPPEEEAFHTADRHVPPRSPAEKTLARIWSEVLKIESIGIRQNFFEIGGQSLMAVSLFARIEKEFDRRLPLATLLRAPTIEQLAEELTGKPGGAKAWPSLAPIQTAGTSPPLFLVHGAGGNVLLYRSLAEHLAPEIPLYGLQSQGLDGISKPFGSIEEMATQYISEIRAVQPGGPYYLGGYCLGGNIAYEMAQQLVRSGQEVALVAMLDTYNWHLLVATDTFETRVSRTAELLKFHLVNIAKLKPREVPGYIGEKVRMTNEYVRARLKSVMGKKPAGDLEQSAVVFIHASNDIAAANYRPTPYAGRVTLLKPHVNYKSYPDPKMGWGDLVLGGLDIVELPVFPHAMLVEPYVKHLAARLKHLVQTLHAGRNKAQPVPSNGTPSDDRAVRRE